MKRLLILLILLLAFPAYGQQCGEQVARLSPAMVGGGVPAAASGTGVIGTSSTDNTYAGQEFIGYYLFTPFVTTTAGTVSYGHIYLNIGSANTKVVLSIHNSSTGAMVCSASTTVVGTGAQWINIATNSGTCSVSAATTYWLALQFDKNLGAVLQSYGADDVKFLTHAMEDPAGTISIEDVSDTDRGLVILFNNTAGNPT